MDKFDTIFEAFWQYAGPFLLLWWAYDLLVRRRETARDIAVGVFSGVFGVYGLVRLVMLLLEGEP